MTGGARTFLSKPVLLPLLLWRRGPGRGGRSSIFSQLLTGYARWGFARQLIRKVWPPRSVAQRRVDTMFFAQTQHRGFAVSHMKILLQHRQNRLYFRRPRVWTADLQAAHDF